MQDTAIAVVPAYREATVIGPVVQSLRAVVAEVVVVDDGSDDATAAVARAAGATVLRHVVNRGQGAALQTGFDFVLTHRTAAHVVTFDADGQHRVEDAARMLQHAREHDLDVVLASRFLGACTGVPRSRRVLLRAALWFSRRLSGLDLTDTHNGLRVLRREALAQVRLRCRGMAHASELESVVARSGLRWAEVPTTVVYSDYSRAKGQSSSNAVNVLFDLALNHVRATR